MKRFYIVILVIALLSCGSRTLNEYEKLVDRTDRIVICKHGQRDSIIISNTTHLQNIKEILKRNIKPEYPRKFIADRSVVLYASGRTIGVLMLSHGEKPYVNFRSDSLNFSFPMTYGIGMSLSELASENSR